MNAGAALAVDAIVVALALLDGRRTRSPRLTRSAPRLSSLAAPTEVVVGVENASRRTIVARVTDDPDPRLRRVAGADGRDPWEDGILVEVPAGGEVRRSYRVEPRARGFLSLGAMHVRTRSPWGLAWRCRSLDVSHAIQVQPGVRDLLRSRSRHALRRRLEAQGRRRARQTGAGREFESLRDYVRGDDPRTIDHKASAKRGSFVVRSYEVERSQNVVLAIDCGRLMRERLSPVRERMDYALGACMMLASRAQRFGDRIGVLAFDERVRLVAPMRRADPAALAPVLAGVETRLVEPNYPMALATLARTFRKRSLVVLFCDVVDPAASGPLVESLVRIGGAHLALAIAIGNPELTEVARRRAPTTRDVYRRAAAEELTRSRAATLEAMRRRGVHVVDTPPGDALVRTLDKYVEIKERGWL